MEIEHMKEYVALAENLNFTTTAEQLYITQSALSRHISYVEEHIGAQLFVRSPHSVKITPAGKVVYEDFKTIVAAYDALKRKMETMSNGSVGNLTIGMLYYCVDDHFNPTMRSFKKKYPGINMSIYSYQVHDVIRELKDNKIDIGMLMRSKFPTSDELLFHRIGRERLKAIVLPDHPFAKRESVSLEEISEQRMVILANEPVYTESIALLLRIHDAYPKDVVYAENIDTMLVTMEATNSIAVGPECLRNIPQKGLVFVDIDSDDMFFDICFVYRLDNDNPAIPLFVKCTP